MKAYKGFNKDLQCCTNGKVFQYSIGGEYEEEKAELCAEGFHACENPLDVMSFYRPGDSRYCEVDLSGDVKRDEIKSVGKNIKVKAEIGIAGLIKGGVEFIYKKSTTGYMAHAATTGDRANAATTGYMAHAATTGDRAHAATTGNRAHAATTGNMAHAATTGYDANAATTGDSAHAATTGYDANAAVKGKNSIAAALGEGGMAKGEIGCYIVLAEYGVCGTLLNVKAGKIDGETLKANTFYRLKNGEFVEAE